MKTDVLVKVKVNMSRAFMVVAATTILTACLDEHPRGQITEAQAMGTASALYLNTVATLYNYIGGDADSQGLQGTYRGVYDYNTFTTDEAMLPTRGGDWYDGGFWQNLYLHQWTAGDTPLNDTWNYLFGQVVRCNQSLAQIDSHQDLLTADERAAYKAEVRAVRALFYYYLLDLFGRVPIVTSASLSVSDVRQSERGEVFAFVVDELRTVAPLLAAERSNTPGDYYGRMTRPVAWFLLAKLALNAEVYTGRRDVTMEVDGERAGAWEACVRYCDLLTGFGYELESDYAANFAVHNETSKENIFTIPMDKTLYKSVFKNLFRSRHYNHGSAIGMDAENGTAATRSTVAAYGYGTDEVDCRWGINFYSDTVRVDGEIVRLDDGRALVYQPTEVGLDMTGWEAEKTGGARMAKYEIDRTAYSDGLLQENDIVIFRYADVVLMKAEALVRDGKNGDKELNLVRRRVGMGERSATLDNILAERLMELQWEGWRRQDLVRFDRFHQAYDQRPATAGEEDRHTIVFPIPQRVLDLNSALTQNDGY